MAPKGSSSSASSKGMLPPVNPTGSNRQSPRSDAEKLDLVFNYMRNELRWGASDFVKALASARGSSNTRRQAAFATAAYGDSEVLRFYFDDADELRDGCRKSIIKMLDLGKTELRKEVERLGSSVPFNKYDPTTRGQFDSQDMDQTLDMVEEQAPLLL
jgi:hypothetical protein